MICGVPVDAVFALIGKVGSALTLGYFLGYFIERGIRK